MDSTGENESIDLDLTLRLGPHKEIHLKEEVHPKSLIDLNDLEKDDKSINLNLVRYNDLKPFIDIAKEDESINLDRTPDELPPSIKDFHSTKEGFQEHKSIMMDCNGEEESIDLTLRLGPPISRKINDDSSKNNNEENQQIDQELPEQLPQPSIRIFGKIFGPMPPEQPEQPPNAKKRHQTEELLQPSQEFSNAVRMFCQNFAPMPPEQPSNSRKRHQIMNDFSLSFTNQHLQDITYNYINPTQDHLSMMLPSKSKKKLQMNHFNLCPGKTEEILAPSAWATRHRAKMHNMDYILSQGIEEISDMVQCKKCAQIYSIRFNLRKNLEKVESYIRLNKNNMQERAPKEWIDPILPTCELCREENCLSPIIAEKKRSINWLFLFLGSLIGCCSLKQIKYFCKHNKKHRTGQKDRLVYVMYLMILDQLKPNGPLMISD